MLNLFNKKIAATENVTKKDESFVHGPASTNSENESKPVTSKMNGRKFSGVVVSDKMKKTVIVAVSYEKKHSKYQKYYTITRRFKAHDENNDYHIGDKVVIQETRPLSKEKRWVVINKL